MLRNVKQKQAGPCAVEVSCVSWRSALGRSQHTPKFPVELFQLNWEGKRVGEKPGARPELPPPLTPAGRSHPSCKHTQITLAFPNPLSYCLPGPTAVSRSLCPNAVRERGYRGISWLHRVLQRTCFWFSRLIAESPEATSSREPRNQAWFSLRVNLIWLFESVLTTRKK